MRDIIDEVLFRGFHPDKDGEETVIIDGKKIKGTWYYGELLRDFTSGIFAIVTYVNLGGNIQDLSEISIFKVIPETVGQYTGLTDKNGKKIFEEDIVSGTAYSSEWIGEIVWIDEIASFGVRYFHRTDPTAWENSSILKAVSMGRQDKFAAKIIGNIHDNPGLLEDGDK